MMEQSRLEGTLTIVVRDRLGQIKPMWQENALHRWFLRRRIDPPKIPLLLGRWRKQKIVQIGDFS